MKQASQSNDASSAVLRQERAREHLRSRPSSAARGDPQRKTQGAPRRPTTATPSLRPVLDRKAGTEAAHLQLQHGAAYFQAARRATTFRAECSRRSHTAAQSTGAFPARHKTASKAAHSKRSSLPLLITSATPTALVAAKLVIQLCAMSGWLISFCRTTAQRNRGSKMAVALKGKQRSAAPPAS